FTATSSRKAFSSAFTGDETGKVKITNKEQTDDYLKRLDTSKYAVTSVKKGTRKKQPAPPFITSTLQQDASRRLGFQTRRTMKVAQELYEGVDIKGIGTAGLITYMRTDSLRISEEAREQAKDFITETYGEKYLPEKPRYFKSRNNAQDAHEAIRPTMISLTPDKAKESLSPEQLKLYTLIWQRFVASLMATCIQNTVKVEIKAVDEKDSFDTASKFCTFSTSGYSIKFDGFTTLYDADTEDEESGIKIPELVSGDLLKVKDILGNQHFTQPPARFTEASLVKALEENGVGRPSTYASIITTIVSREYVIRDGKMLKPTELGEATTNLLKSRFPKFVSAKFTAQMETFLDEVSEGKEEYIEVIREFYDDLEETLKKAKVEMEGIKIQLAEDLTDIPCDKCGKLMVIKTGRFGKFLACPGYPDCKNTKPLIQETGALCPKCGGKIIQRKSKKGYVFYGCDNYPNCDFITWDQPTKDLCPQCQKHLFKRKGSLVCLAEGCGYEIKTAEKKKSAKDEEKAKDE
ncbi:MAG: type I DNA topoisomerase, partial [Oscillospiraceae bacterium]